MSEIKTEVPPGIPGLDLQQSPYVKELNQQAFNRAFLHLTAKDAAGAVLAALTERFGPWEAETILETATLAARRQRNG
jgi:hypothetical protein